MQQVVSGLNDLSWHHCVVIQGLYNVQTTSTKSAEDVLAELQRVVEEADIVFRVKGYVMLAFCRRDTVFYSAVLPLVHSCKNFQADRYHNLLC